MNRNFTKTLLAFLFALSSTTFCMSQNFTLLATDTMGDPTQGFSLDAKSISYAYDVQQDSLWFKIETWDSITGDWGIYIGIDNDLNTTNGATWPGQSNSSIKIEREITFLNNQWFPPTFTSLVDDSGNTITTSIDFYKPDSFTLVMSLKLSDIDSDTNMNVIAGTGSFDDFIYDDIPDNGFMTIPSVVTARPNAVSQQMKVYPTATAESWHLEFPDALNEGEWNLSLLTADGKLVKSEVLSNGIQEMDFPADGIAAGTYFLTVSDGDRAFSAQVIRQ